MSSAKSPARRSSSIPPWLGDAGSAISPASRRGRLGLTAALAIYTIWIIATADRFHFLDSVNLAIHESGHLAFAWGGEVLAALGGTLLQLLMPLAIALSFWRRGDGHAASVALWWTGQNCFNIARYIGDARAQELPLVGGGEHDWTFLLAHWGVLDRDLGIARDVRFLGVVVTVAALALGGWTVTHAPRTDRSPSEPTG